MCYAGTGMSRGTRRRIPGRWRGMTLLLCQRVVYSLSSDPSSAHHTLSQYRSLRSMGQRTLNQCWISRRRGIGA
eukprot:3844610-Rhodomonas_salina.1